MLVLLLACRAEEVRPRETGLSPPPQPTHETAETAETGQDPCEIAAMALGTGAEGYLPLAAYDLVTLVHGPQGGWHIDVGAQVTGLGQVVSVLPEVRRASDGARISSNTLPEFIGMSAQEPCGYVFWGIRALLTVPEEDPIAYICGLSGEELLLSVRVEDLQTGIALEETISVVGASDEDDPCP